MLTSIEKLSTMAELNNILTKQVFLTGSNGSTEQSILLANMQELVNRLRTHETCHIDYITIEDVLTILTEGLEK